MARFNSFRLKKVRFAQGGDDPALDHLNGIFHDRLVPGLSRTGGKDGHLIVGGHIGVGGVQIGFVAAGLMDSAFEIVWSYDAGQTAEFKGMDVGGFFSQSRMSLGF